MVSPDTLKKILGGVAGQVGTVDGKKTRTYRPNQEGYGCDLGGKSDGMIKGTPCRWRDEARKKNMKKKRYGPHHKNTYGKET